MFLFLLVSLFHSRVWRPLWANRPRISDHKWDCQSAGICKEFNGSEWYLVSTSNTFTRSTVPLMPCYYLGSAFQHTHTVTGLLLIRARVLLEAENPRKLAAWGVFSAEHHHPLQLRPRNPAKKKAKSFLKRDPSNGQSPPFFRAFFIPAPEGRT